MRLALSYRDEAQRTRASQWFEENGREQPLWIKLDVTDRTAFAEAADDVMAHFGKVHVLVNNAGVGVFGPTDEASYDDFDWIMGVNFGGVVNGIVSFVPRIKATGEGGHVVNVASMAASFVGAAGGHLHRLQVRGARPHGIAALQSRALWHRRVAGLPGARRDRRGPQRPQAPGRIRGERFRPGQRG